MMAFTAISARVAVAARSAPITRSGGVFDARCPKEPCSSGMPMMPSRPATSLGIRPKAGFKR